MQHRYLFVLCAPFCGSTLMHRILASSPNASHLRVEGQLLDEVKDVMLADPWRRTAEFPWPRIREVWHEHWDLDKSVLVEKSPPNLLRADQIEEHFVPASFLIMVRNPYAACEGAHRRNGMTFEAAARSWLRLARRQLSNRRNLERTLFFTYEELSERPDSVAARIVEFIPELERLDTSNTFYANTVHGWGKNKIQNYNADKIAKLADQDVAEINTVLETHPKVMTELGYDLLHR